MATDDRIRQTVNYGLLSFLKGIGCGDMQFKVLCFWGRHPKVKLSLCAIARVLHTTGINLRDTITALVEKGILIAQYNNSGLTTYALSGDHRVQQYIDELAKLDWGETLGLGKQLQHEVALSTGSGRNYLPFRDRGNYLTRN